MEGTFNISDEVVEILSAPPWTKRLLAEVRDAIRAGQESAERANTESELQSVIEHLRTEVAQTNSMLADFIAKETAGKRRDAIVRFLGFLFTVLAWAVPVSEVTGLARDTIAPSIHQLWDQYLNKPHIGP